MSELKILPTNEYLHSIFDYHPDGYLVWKINRRKVKAGDKAGKLHRSGYIIVGLDREEYAAHRLIYQMMIGPLIYGLVVDHKDAVKSNNRIDNLQQITVRENSIKDMSVLPNKTGYRGVTLDNRDVRYRATIICDGKKIELGRYTSAEVAAQRYDEAAIDFFGKYAILNFPQRFN